VLLEGDRLEQGGGATKARMDRSTNYDRVARGPSAYTKARIVHMNEQLLESKRAWRFIGVTQGSDLCREKERSSNHNLSAREDQPVHVHHKQASLPTSWA
jgi:hypothetical protein